MQPKPMAQTRHEKRVSEQTPRAKLQVIFRMDGISAEPLMIYRNTPAQEQTGWGKTSFHPSQNDAAMPPAQQRHLAQVSQTVQGMAEQQERQKNMMYRAGNLQEVARQHTHRPAKEQERELEHER
ncbi:MAG: hypothetical protein AAF702_38080 [Chloroflexota bacterium]